MVNIFDFEAALKSTLLDAQSVKKNQRVYDNTAIILIKGRAQVGWTAVVLKVNKKMKESIRGN